MQDHQLEKQITSLGLTAPRVTVNQVDDLVAQLSYHTYVIPGTTTTIAAAIDPTGFVLGLGQAASVSAANFDEVIGRNRAKSRAEAMAREELWKLEGYRLSRNLSEAAKAGLISTVATYAGEGEQIDAAFVADLAACGCAVAATESASAGPVAAAR
ncbi:hypothetical protein QEL94_004332 [Pseudomonas putida]|nr:hypothetical protein [Pseudomonas putida]